MGYKVIGTLKHDDTTFNHGDSITASKVGGEDNFKELVAGKAVVTDEEFKQLYPGGEGTVNDPTGTPSNLQPVEGTVLQAPMPPDDPAEEKTTPPPNPANPPEVKGAGDPKAAAKKVESQNK